MAPKYNKIHNRFKFNGLNFTYDDLKEVAYCLIKEEKRMKKLQAIF